MTEPTTTRPTTRATTRDELPAELTAAVRTLSRLPVASPGAVDRVLDAVAADGGWRAGVRPAARRTRRLVVAGGALLAASLGAIAVLRPAADAPVVAAATGVDVVTPAPAATGTPVLPAGGGDAALAAIDDAPRAVSFVLARPTARAVALVGAFNRWDPTATPMRRLPDGTWTAEVALPPGRHAYGFVVDGTRWIADPRLPAERDPDFGRDHSVVVVGLP